MAHAPIAINVCPLSTKGTPNSLTEKRGFAEFGTKKEIYCENPIQPEAMDSGELKRICHA
jgi:hypothetical protein